LGDLCVVGLGNLVWQDSGVLGHVGMNVPNLGGAQAYYNDLLPLLGLEMFFSADDQCAYRPAGGKPGTYLFLYPAADPTPYSRDKTGLQHLALMLIGWIVTCCQWVGK
jgi:catechol 2,3-dioxygenase-like lactoylglutathione lyase family enzyme